MKPSHPDAVFGPDSPPAERKRLTYREVASYLEEIDTRALTPADATDVLALLDFMHDHTLKLIAQNDEASIALHKREAALAKRESDLALRQRAVESVLKVSPAPAKRRYFWG